MPDTKKQNTSKNRRGRKALNKNSDQLLSELEFASLSLVSKQLFDTLITDHNSLDNQPGIEQNTAAEELIASETSRPVHEIGRQLRSRVAFVSRGKQLVRRTTSTAKRLGTISQAILTGFSVEGRYNRRHRVLNPYALIVREPKIYLLATENISTLPKDRGNEQSNESPVIRQFLCNRFEELTLSLQPNDVPTDFSVDEYLSQNGLDIQITALQSSLPQPFQLDLQVRAEARGSFIRDLEEFPLSKSQSMVKQSKEGYYLLQVPQQTPTISLVEWILGRQDRVEVLAPLPLRQYIIGRLFSTAQLYTESTTASFESSTTLIPSALPATQKNDHLALGSTGNPELDAARRSAVNPPRSSRYAKSTIKNSLITSLIIKLLNESTILDRCFKKDDLNKLKRYLPKEAIVAAGKAAARPLRDALKKLASEPGDISLDADDPFTKNTNYLASMLDMSPCELAILRIATLINHNAGLQHAFDMYEPMINEQTLPDCFALLSGYTPELIEYSLRHDQILRRSGLIQQNRYGLLQIKDAVKMAPMVVSNLLTEQPSDQSILSTLSNKAPPACITDDDLNHVAIQVRHASALLRGAVDTRTSGFNILLWGIPGGGKTENSRHIVQSLGLNAYEVKTVGAHDESLTEADRLSSYRLCQSLLAKANKAALIFDEIENIIDPLTLASNHFSKAYINQTLEENAVPAIWISNQVKHADPAFLRRFDFIVDLNNIDLESKRRLASRLLSDIPISGELLEDFLLREEVGPATLAKLKRVAELSGLNEQPDIDELTLTMIQGDLAAVGAKPLKVTRIAGAEQPIHLPYDEEFFNADTDLVALAQDMNPDTGVRLLLYGPPGTGKTAWAEHLAKSLKKPAHLYEGSDIKGKYVGETENNVAKAFARASKEKAVLIFDEVDSYLRFRDMARQKHQVDMVNQFLTSMEGYQGILVCSTNLIKTLDPAALRRFDYKVEFDYLSASQATRLLIRVAGLLGLDTDETELEALNLTIPDKVLTPGDYAIHLRRARLRSTTITLETLYAELMTESGFRNPPSRSVGFI